MCRLLILHRTPYDPLVSRLIAAVHSRGGLVLLDADDLIFDTSAFQWIDSPDFKDPVRAQLYQAEMQRQQQTLLASDAVITSTDYLAEVVKKYQKPVWVHRNAANLEMITFSARAREQKRPPDSKYVIGYASGTPTHNRDFAMITPALMDTLSAMPDAELWLIGYLELEPAWKDLKQRVRTFKPVPWRELPYWLAQLDVNLAPLLLDNPFSQSKSEIKVMEAALVGVPTIASPTDAYRFAIQHGENGLLASSTGDWLASLQFLADPDKRASLGERARLAALSQYTPRVRAHQAVDLLNQIAEHFGQPAQWQITEESDQEHPQYNWPVDWEAGPSLIELGWYSLRSRGIITLLKQIWITFRRFIARWIPYS